MPDDPILADAADADLPVPVETADAHKYDVVDDLGKALVAEASKAEPAFTISKWQGESELTISYDLAATADAVSEPGKIAYKTGAREVHMYPVKDGFEIEIILLSVPGSNRFDFALEGSAGLLFHKQPEAGENFCPLPEVVSWSDTECFNVDDFVVASRAINVPGSIAIYSGKKHGKYGTGKIGHIYRPKAIDAKNVETWCGLEYLAGVLTVVVPQAFLDSATYPVVVDPTLGYTTIGGSDGTFTSLFYDTEGPYVATEDGTITGIQFHHPTSSTANLTKGVYHGNGGVPDDLVGNTAGGPDSGTGWVSEACSGSIVNGESYWMSYYSDGAGDIDRIHVSYDTTGTDRFYLSVSGAYVDGTMADPHPSGTPLGLEYSLYLDYDAAGGDDVVASADFNAAPAVFAAEATVAVPEFNASADFNAPAAIFAAEASTGAPVVIEASAAFVAPAAVFAAEASVNSAPVVDAGPNQTVDLPTLTATMNGTITDDGLPDPPGDVTILWTKISGPSTVVFTDDSDPDTLVTFGAAGVYRLQLSADDGSLVTTDTVRIWIRDPSASGAHRSKTGREVDGFGYGFNFGY